MLVPDTVSQVMFSIIGGEAAITAASSGGVGSAAAYQAYFSHQLLYCFQLLTYSLKLLSEQFVGSLTNNADNSEKMVESTPLQAEKLISVLGYDRAVQVARIAALTEKPVRTVAVKMKLMTEAEVDEVFRQVEKQTE